APRPLHSFPTRRSSDLSLSQSTTTTVAPSRAKRIAVARPMAPPPPVTIAICPAKRVFITFALLDQFAITYTGSRAGSVLRAVASVLQVGPRSLPLAVLIRAHI